MARIDEGNIEQLTKDRNHVHETVKATYTVFKDNRGQKYFQIDTYGSEHREIKGKISQSLQFDDKTGKFLINIIKTKLEI